MATTVKKRGERAVEPLRIPVHPLERADGGGYRCCVIRSGFGNARDKNYYPASTLETAVRERKFEGLKAYADHPRRTDERERPERSIRDVIGHFEDATFQENEVRARFHAITGPGFEWVASLIESSLNGSGSLVGISIDGDGQAEPGQVDSKPCNIVRHIETLKSADVVTAAGAGGRFLSKLIESAREPVQLMLGPVRPAERDERIRGSVDALVEAIGAEDAAAGSEALTDLRRWVSVPAAGDGAAPPTSRAGESTAGLVVVGGGSGDPVRGLDPAPDRDPLLDDERRRREVRAARERAERAERELERMRTVREVSKIVQEERLDPSVAELHFPTLCSEHASAKLTRERVREIARVDRDRRAAAAQELRESLGLTGVEGAGPRAPQLPWANGNGGTDLLSAMGIHGGER